MHPSIDPHPTGRYLLHFAQRHSRIMLGTKGVLHNRTFQVLGHRILQDIQGYQSEWMVEFNDSVRIGYLIDDWQQTLIGQAIEPDEGCVGDRGNPQAYTYYLRPNVISFQMDDKHRYQLMGDFSFFEAEYAQDNVRLHSFYDREHASYRTTKATFLAGETLYHQNRPLFVNGGIPVFSQVGGLPRLGNWTGSSDFPMNQNPDRIGWQGDVHPLAEDGQRFYFIASVHGHYFRESGADEILLFYEPIKKIALLTFDWG